MPDPVPTREECLRAAAKILVAEVIRIERERLEREAAAVPAGDS